MDEQHEFLSNEVNSLRESIRNRILIIENDIRYAIVLSGAAWAWILTHKITNTALGFSFSLIPLLVTILIIYKWRIQDRAITKISDYIVNVETYFKLPDGYGWETSIRKPGSTQKAIKKHVNDILSSLLAGNFIGVIVCFILGNKVVISS